MKEDKLRPEETEKKHVTLEAGEVKALNSELQQIYAQCLTVNLQITELIERCEKWGIEL